MAEFLNREAGIDLRAELAKAPEPELTPEAFDGGDGEAGAPDTDARRAPEPESKTAAEPAKPDAEEPDDLTDAARVLEQVLGQSPHADGGTRLSAPLPDADQGIDALAALRGAGISVASLQVSKPSLDEVFLTLTGDGTPGPGPDAALQPAAR